MHTFNSEKKFDLKKPKLKNKSEWYSFCFGNNKLSQSDDAPKSSTQDTFKGNKPLLNILYEMDQVFQRMIIYLLILLIYI